MNILEAPRAAVEPGTVEANIGHTPLLRLRLLDDGLREGVQVFAKQNISIRVAR